MSIVKTEPASSRASPLSTQLRPANVTRSMQRSISHSATSVAALRLWRQDIAFHQGVAGGVVFAAHDRSGVGSWTNSDDGRLIYIGRRKSTGLNLALLAVLPVVVGAD